MFVASGPLLVGDAIGIAVMTPLVLRFILHIPHLSLQTLRAFAPEVALYVAVVLLFLWFIGLTESESGFKLFYLFFLPVVVAAIRYGLDGACLGLALTQLGLVGLLHLHGYDANVFTEFQILMLVLTATGLTVGVTVNERQQADRAVREVEALLRSKEAEAAQAERFNLVSSMASALAHEINQPITAARALGRAAQHLLHNDSGSHARVDDNLTTMIAQIDHAAGVVKRMREFLRRGEPHISTINVRALIDDARRPGRHGSSERCRSGSRSTPLPICRRCMRTACNCSRSSSIWCRTRSMRSAAAGRRRRPDPDRGHADGQPAPDRNRRRRQRRRHRTGAGRTAVRAAHDLQARRARAGPVDLRDNRAVASRPALATIGRARRNRIPLLAPSRTGNPRMTSVFVIDDQNSVRHALGEMLRVFGFTVEVFEFRRPVPANRLPGRAGCVVADVRMPGMDGIELVRELARRKIALPVVLISGHADVPMAVAGIKAGAEDFIEKPIDDKQLVAAINRGLARTFEQQVSKQSQDALAESFSRLTPRQVEIFDLVANGFTSQAIASKLDISIRTVESYRAQIMEKMQAESVAVLVRQAIRLGRISA